MQVMAVFSNVTVDQALEHFAEAGVECTIWESAGMYMFGSDSEKGVTVLSVMRPKHYDEFLAHCVSLLRKLEEWETLVITPSSEFLLDQTGNSTVIGDIR